MITHISVRVNVVYVVKDKVEWKHQEYFKYKCLLTFSNQFHEMDISLNKNVIIVYAFIHNYYVYDYSINKKRVEKLNHDHI